MKENYYKKKLDDKALKYHLKQFEKPYRSTIKFCEFIEKYIDDIPKNGIIDIACGSGANVYYMNKIWNTRTIGMDFNPELVKIGKSFAKNKENIDFLQMDLYKLNEIKNREKILNLINRKKFGITSYQTLSWLKSWKLPFEKMLSLEPSWICISSLFYDGPLEYKIVVKDLTRNGIEYFYNIYSIQKIADLLTEYGYNCYYKKFEIDMELPKPKDGNIGTYTIKSEEGLLQMSGALYLPWYFILGKKK
ncbi:MAG: methyltransferase domain-containing protein [Candidatus Lokiarchaeota archaeon]|nr:methyltransferase domain-containing protein [Candidatus Lokiarchaeota archaeon]